ncbi:MAG: ABC transporter ATP-binding protein/permease [Microthrixaceae bacterium]|nr:ABC transporter ATP-binding protein/permease [Microthrixaceae bacterium]
MGTLGITSFFGAMLEAGFLVLLSSTVLALTAGREELGPLAGRSVALSVGLWTGAVSVVLRLALNLATVRISAALSAVVRTEERRRVTRAFLRSDWAVHQSEPTGRLQELLTSFVGRINAAVLALTQAVTSALSLFAFLAVGFFVDPVATLVVLGGLGFFGALLNPIRQRIRNHARDSADTDLDFATTIAELGALGQEMQTFGVRDRFEERLDEVIEATTEQQRRVQVLYGSLSPAYTSLAYAAIIGAVALLQVFGVDDFATVGAIMLLMLRSLSYGQQLAAVAGQLAASTPSLEQVDQTVARYRSRQADVGSNVTDHVVPVAFSGASFAYSPDRPALSDVNVVLGSGEMLGVIGPSGAGKSTFAQLLLGLRAPSTGSVIVGGVDLRSVDRGWWTSRVSFVPQDPTLFTGTVAENIRFFRDGLSDEDLRAAAKQANVLDDIERLPNGFDTHLGQRGSQLSGGQRQRLSIARALVGAPELLVLDEPTSALDGKSEALIRETLAALHGDTAVVIIAHRMSTLDLCDRIMVIEEGYVTGLDSPSALRDTNTFYQEALAVAGLG